MMKKALIVAKARNDVIGNQGQLPWHLPDDLRYFKKVTNGQAIIMGRKTYLSIGRPFLPNRLNIILTRNLAYQPDPACLVTHTLEAAFGYAREAKVQHAFVIGGAQVYQDSLPLVDKMYITSIDSVFEGDTYFPKVDWKKWYLTSKLDHEKDEQHSVSFSFLCYRRTSSLTYPHPPSLVKL